MAMQMDLSQCLKYLMTPLVLLTRVAAKERVLSLSILNHGTVIFMNSCSLERIMARRNKERVTCSTLSGFLICS